MTAPTPRVGFSRTTPWLPGALAGGTFLSFAARRTNFFTTGLFGPHQEVHALVAFGTLMCVIGASTIRTTRWSFGAIALLLAGMSAWGITSLVPRFVSPSAMRSSGPTLQAQAFTLVGQDGCREIDVNSLADPPVSNFAEVCAAAYDAQPSPSIYFFAARTRGVYLRPDASSVEPGSACVRHLTGPWWQFERSASTLSECRYGFERFTGNG